MGAVDGALSKIADALNVSHTTALYVGIVAALSAMLSSLFAGTILGRKLPYKTAALFYTSLVIIGGSVPVFAKSFSLILITRLFFGMGLGGAANTSESISDKTDLT